MVYADTSVVLALYRPETSSARAQAFFSNLREPALISSLTETEVASALAKWVRNRDISEADAHRIYAAFRDDMDEGCYSVVPISQTHYRQANTWLLSRKSSLGTLDALHLACAAKHQAPMASFDKSMRSAAAAFGVMVHDF